MRHELVQESNEIRVWRVTSEFLDENCYLLEVGDHQTCLVIDPGLDCDAIEEAIQEINLTPKAILCTHGHFDHVGSARRLQDVYQCPVFLHSDDEKTLRSSNFMLMALGSERRIELPEVSWLFGQKPQLQYGGNTVTFILVPGHSPGSCVIHIGNLAFTGDSLYAKRLGLSKLPTGKPDELKFSIRLLFDTLPSETFILPGHGSSQSLLWIQENNLELQTFLGEKSENAVIPL
jgi:glyoxylase-like metal-dependent hydrolase (beta-lactamase superfamily II)